MAISELKDKRKKDDANPNLTEVMGITKTIISSQEDQHYKLTSFFRFVTLEKHIMTSNLRKTSLFWSYLKNEN